MEQPLWDASVAAISIQCSATNPSGVWYPVFHNQTGMVLPSIHLPNSASLELRTSLWNQEGIHLSKPMKFDCLLKLFSDGSCG